MPAGIGRPPTRRRMVATFRRSAAASISSHGSNDESRTVVALGAAIGDRPDRTGVAAAARRNARRDFMVEEYHPNEAPTTGLRHWGRAIAAVRIPIRDRRSRSGGPPPCTVWHWPSDP